MMRFVWLLRRGVGPAGEETDAVLSTVLLESVQRVVKVRLGLLELSVVVRAWSTNFLNDFHRVGERWGAGGHRRRGCRRKSAQGESRDDRDKR